MATARAEMQMAGAPLQDYEQPAPRQRSREVPGAARALGWLSVGLGLAELMAPHAFGRALGVRRPWTLRALGLREIASGVGILTQPQQPAWLWSRVAGDALDLALLGAAFSAPEARRARLTTAMGAVSLVTALDVMYSRQVSRAVSEPAAPLQFNTSLAIERSPEELYRFWRELENLPRFMRYLREVRKLDEQRSHWVAAGPAGTNIEWDAEITAERAGEMIAWRSLPGSPIQTSGTVRFEPAPNGEGAFVRVQLSYEAPAGAVGAAVAKLLGAISKEEVKAELRRFKQLMETGEVATIDGQTSGRRSTLVKLVNKVMHP